MNIDPVELKDFLDTKAEFLLLDVREEWEYEEYNIGGLNIPLNDLPFRLNEIARWKTKKVVVHCKSGNRGRTGTKYLSRQGFADVWNLEGGIQAFLEYYPNIPVN